MSAKQGQGGANIEAGPVRYISLGELFPKHPGVLGAPPTRVHVRHVDKSTGTIVVELTDP
jgi:hypothetical protein